MFTKLIEAAYTASLWLMGAALAVALIGTMAAWLEVAGAL